MSRSLLQGYPEFLADLKKRVETSRYRAVQAVNLNLILLYHHIGAEILTRQALYGWGAKVIDQLSKDLISMFPEMKGFSSRNLKYICRNLPRYSICADDTRTIDLVS